MLQKLVLSVVAMPTLSGVMALTEADARPVGVPSAETAGTFVLAGGGRLDPAIRRRFIELAGGPDAVLVVIPSASSLRGTAASTRAAWTGVKVRSLAILDADSRKEANDPRCYGLLTKATGVWLGGGDQARLLALYGGTRVESELHALLRRGGVVGGTSAGASCVSSVMVYEDGEMRGFGLLPGVIVDQHFSERHRLPRLRKLLRRHPGLIGVGIDEGTAAVIHDGRLTVLGEGKVGVYSQRAMENGKVAGSKNGSR